jgi:hypothetical protein
MTMVRIAPVRFLADEDFDNKIVRALRRRKRDIDLVRVQEAMLSGAADADLLEWAALHGRVVLTHDVSTMTKHAYQRVAAGLPMPGVFEVPRSLPRRQAVEDVLLIAACSLENEWEGQVRYLPLR